VQELGRDGMGYTYDGGSTAAYSFSSYSGSASNPEAARRGAAELLARANEKVPHLAPQASKADKRAHHNALERKRRDHIKDSFTVLRDSIPTITGEKSSRAQILNKATEHIKAKRSNVEKLQAQLAQELQNNEKLAAEVATLGGSAY
jgi:chromosome segregation ATPase